MVSAECAIWRADAARIEDHIVHTRESAVAEAVKVSSG
jgi:hypothetical protein